MSKISIEGNALGSGTFTIASPNSNTNRTLNLPDSSGTVVLTQAAGGVSTNTAVGTDALAANTTGANNTAVGYQALDVNTTGAGNTAVGSAALGSNTTGSSNTVIGRAAADAITTAGGCTAVGNDALGANVAVNNCTAVGSGALIVFNGASASEDGCTAVGQGALSACTTGGQNTALGRDAGNRITTGYQNTIVGTLCYGPTTGIQNVLIGQGVAQAMTTGSNNVGIGGVGDGNRVLAACTTGSDNVAVGTAVLKALTTGASNTAVGAYAGYEQTTGSNNLLLGAGSGRAASPSGSITTGSNIVCLGNNSITDLFCADTTISSSDARDKTDVQDFTHGLDWITQLRPVTYRWDKRAWYVGDDATTEDVLNAQPDGSKKQNRLNLGFLAQEEIAVEQRFGFANTWEDMLVAAENEDGSAYGLKYERLVPVLVNAIKELSAQVTALQAEVESLKNPT